MKPKGILLLFTIVILSLGTVWAAEEAEPPTVDPAAPQECEYRSAEQIVDTWLAELRKAPVSVPDCPAENNNCSSNNLCTGMNPCGVSGDPSSVDTGLTKCRTAGGSLLNCASSGETIHVTTWPCSQCPCCTAQPYPCFCPSQCSQVVRLTCGEYGGTGAP